MPSPPLRRPLQESEHLTLESDARASSLRQASLEPDVEALQRALAIGSGDGLDAAAINQEEATIFALNAKKSLTVNSEEKQIIPLRSTSFAAGDGRTPRGRFESLMKQLNVEFEMLLTENESLRNGVIAADSWVASMGPDLLTAAGTTNGIPPPLQASDLLTTSGTEPSEGSRKPSPSKKKGPLLPQLLRASAGDVTPLLQLHEDWSHSTTTMRTTMRDSAYDITRTESLWPTDLSVEEFLERGSTVSRDDQNTVFFQEQFERLDERGRGLLGPEVCYALVKEHVRTDIPQKEIVVDAMKEIAECCAQFNSNGQVSGDGLNLWAFCQLMSLDAAHIKPFARLTYCPVAAVRIALEKEQQQFELKEAARLIEEHTLKREKRQGLMGLMLDVIPSCVISINALVMGLQLDIAPKSPVWDVCEIVFMLFYIGEALLRLSLSGCYKYTVGPDKWWNLFDWICITLSLADLSISKLLNLLAEEDGNDTDLGSLMLMKMLRLVRLARLVRILQYDFFDELKLIVLGVVSGLRVLFWALVLLIVAIFCFGVVLTKLFGEEEPELSSLPASMFTAFRCLTDGCSARDGTPFHERLRMRHGPLFALFYILAFMFMTFGLFNLIIAVFIDCVLTRSHSRRQKELGECAVKIKSLLETTFAKLWARDCRRSFRGAVINAEGTSEFTEKGNLTHLPPDFAISRELFNLWLKDPDVIKVLDVADIDPSIKFELFDVLDVDMGGELTIDELISGLMRMRGAITKADIVAVRLKMRYATGVIKDIATVLGCMDDQQVLPYTNLRTSMVREAQKPGLPRFAS